MRRIARGWRKIPGEMNGLERDYLAHLLLLKVQGDILGYWYECIKLKLGSDWKTTILIDFFVLTKDLELEAHEVKGSWFPAHNRAKLKIAAAQYPFRFLLVRRPRKDGPWEYEEVV